jgi:hypothetical protein
MAPRHLKCIPAISSARPPGRPPAGPWSRCAWGRCGSGDTAVRTSARGAYAARYRTTGRAVGATRRPRGTLVPTGRRPPPARSMPVSGARCSCARFWRAARPEGLADARKRDAGHRRRCRRSSAQDAGRARREPARPAAGPCLRGGARGLLPTGSVHVPHVRGLPRDCAWSVCSTGLTSLTRTRGSSDVASSPVMDPARSQAGAVGALCCSAPRTGTRESPTLMCKTGRRPLQGGTSRRPVRLHRCVCASHCVPGDEQDQTGTLTCDAGDARARGRVLAGSPRRPSPAGWSRVASHQRGPFFNGH